VADDLHQRSDHPGPLPDEALEALVLVLDEIRFGRSSSDGSASWSIAG